jgi:hypothetical protein
MGGREMSASRAPSIQVARRPWPLLAVAATVAGLWWGVQAPAVSPVTPAIPIAQGSVVEPAGVDDPSGATGDGDVDLGRGSTGTDSFDDGAGRGGPGDREGRGGRGGGGR